MSLKRTSLYEKHVQLNARMVPFAGYEMPVFYGSIKEEHHSVRKNVGLFDVSHMGTLYFSGPKAEHFLNALTVNDVSALQVGQVQYSAICKEDGGILDDVLVYRVAESDFQMVVNASNKEKIDAWISSRSQEGVKYHFPEDQVSILALQGPRAVELVEALFAAQGLRELKTYWGKTAEFNRAEIFVSRTGYTGEDGYEFSLPSAEAPLLWQKLIELGAAPCGLGCRDTLRLEAGYSLYGHELNEDVDPITAGLGWICPAAKTSFTGSEKISAVRAEGPAQKVVGIELIDKAIPRQGCALVYQGDVVGEITSGSQSPTLEKFIGMAYLRSDLAKVGAEIELDIRGQLKKAKVVSRRFYQRG